MIRKRRFENNRSWCVLLAWCVAGVAFGQVITTEAGGDWPALGVSQRAASTPLGQIFADATDREGNVFVADYDNNQVLRVSRDGNLTLVAGNGFAGFSGDGGQAVNASLRGPKGVAVGPDGFIYISDTGNDRVRVVTPDGVIATIAGNGSQLFSGDGGPATVASLFAPNGLAFDSTGNLFIADTRHNRIRRIASDGVITTVAGNGLETYNGEGAATSYALNGPVSIAFDAAGNLFIADTLNNRIRKVTPSGIMSTFAGTGIPGWADGPAARAVFSYPKGIAFDSAGNLFIADPGNNLIRKIDTAGAVSTVAGNGALAFAGDGGAARSASFGGPSWVAVNPTGDVFIADTSNGRIRLLNAAANTISTFAGNGAYRRSEDGLRALNSFLSNPQDVKIGPDGLLYICDSQNHRVVRINADNTIVTVAGNRRYGYSGDGGAATAASLYFPRQIAFDPSGNLYIADSLNLRVRKVTPQGIISTVAGNGKPGYTGDNGPATSATMNYPTGVAADSAGYLYIADQQNHAIRRVTPSGISTIAGNGRPGYSGDNGPATNATLSYPERIFMDAQGTLYIADIYNHRVRKITKDGVIRLVAGSGVVGYSGDGGPAAQARLYSPAGVAADSAGNVFIADSGNNVIRVVRTDGTILTAAGTGTPGYSGDGDLPSNATFNQPVGISPDGSGGLHIADTLNNRIRRIVADAPSFQVAPPTLSFSAVSAGASTSPQSIALSPTVSGLGFSISTSDSWLSASLGSGSMPINVDIAVDPSQLSPGTYTGTVTITAPLAAQPVQRVTVSVEVTDPQIPVLSAGSKTVSFAVTQGAAPGNSTLTVSNQGSGSVNFTAAASTASGGDWLQVSPAGGSVTPASSAPLTVTATPGSLAPGTYTGAITLTGSGGDNIQIPVTLAVSPAQSKILLSQTGLTFIAVSQGGSVLPQSIGILNVGGGVMDWTAQASTLSGFGWLTLSASGGTVSRPFSDVSPFDVMVNAQTLVPGTYYGQIQVRSQTADNSPQTALVVLQVLAPGSNPGPEVRPSGFIFTGTAGAGNPGSQKLSIANTTNSPIAFGSSPTYVSDSNWIKQLPANASVTPGAPVQMAVQPYFTNLTAGIRRAALTLAFDDGSVRTVSILSVVAPTSAPASRIGSNQAFAGARSSIDGSACQPGRLIPVITQLGSGPTIPAGFPSAMQVRVVDDCANALTTGTVVASFSNGDPSLRLNSLGNGTWSGTWQPVNVPRTGVIVSVKASLPALSIAGAAQFTVGLQEKQPLPVISGGPASAASLAPGRLAPGELVLIQGSSLADGPASSGPTPQEELSGASMLIGGRVAPLVYADASRVMGVVPSDLPINTQQQLVVKRGLNLGLPMSVIVSATNPAVFSADASGQGQGLIYRLGDDGAATTLADASAPANPGDSIVIYCGGLGPTDDQGNTLNPVAVTIGGQPADISYAGAVRLDKIPSDGILSTLGGATLTSLSGVYQINASVPGGIAGSPATVLVSTAGQTSPAGVSLHVGSANAAQSTTIRSPRR